MTLHFRPELDANPARHLISRDCPCNPKVTLLGTIATGFQLAVYHKSNVPWKWSDVARKG